MVASNEHSVVGIVTGYRRGPSIQYPGQVLVSVPVDQKLVYSLVGAKVVVKDKYNNVYVGEIVRVHGSKKPKLVAVFRKNIPGQLVGKQVIIIKKSPKPPDRRGDTRSSNST